MPFTGMPLMLISTGRLFGVIVAPTNLRGDAFDLRIDGLIIVRHDDARIDPLVDVPDRQAADDFYV